MIAFPLVILLLALIGLRELFSAALGGHHALIVLAEIGAGVLAFRLLWIEIGNLRKR